MQTATEVKDERTERELGSTVVQFYWYGKLEQTIGLMSNVSEQRQLCQRLGIEYKKPENLMLVIKCEKSGRTCEILGQEIDKKLFSTVLTSIHEYKPKG